MKHFNSLTNIEYGEQTEITLDYFTSYSKFINTLLLNDFFKNDDVRTLSIFIYKM